MRDAAASVVFPTARGHYCRFAHPDARALLSNLIVFSLSRITRPRRTLAFPRDSPRASPAALALLGAGPRANSRCLARARPACAGSARAVAGAAVTAAATEYVPAPYAHAYPAAGARSRRHRRIRLEPPRRRAASKAGEADPAQEARVAPPLVRDRHRAQAIPREHDAAPVGCCGWRSGRAARQACRGRGRDDALAGWTVDAAVVEARGAASVWYDHSRCCSLVAALDRAACRRTPRRWCRSRCRNCARTEGAPEPHPAATSCVWPERQAARGRGRGRRTGRRRRPAFARVAVAGQAIGVARAAATRSDRDACAKENVEREEEAVDGRAARGGRPGGGGRRGRRLWDLVAARVQQLSDPL